MEPGGERDGRGMGWHPWTDNCRWAKVKVPCLIDGLGHCIVCVVTLLPGALQNRGSCSASRYSESGVETALISARVPEQGSDQLVADATSTHDKEANARQTQA